MLDLGNDTLNLPRVRMDGTLALSRRGLLPNGKLPVLGGCKRPFLRLQPEQPGSGNEQFNPLRSHAHVSIREADSAERESLVTNPLI